MSTQRYKVTNKYEKSSYENSEQQLPFKYADADTFIYSLK